MPRLFIAIDLPDAARSAIAQACTGIAGARWVMPHQLHLTLRFVGDVTDDATAQLQAALGAIRQPRLSLQVKGVGTFPPPGRKPARVLWAGIADNPLLRALQESVSAARPDIGNPPEHAPWSPHITLARFARKPGPELAAWLKAHATLELPPIEVAGFHLFKSELRRGGAVHEIVQSFELAG
ncbi:MAG: RNA 2',3'-cyclic phosphodiesterase [Planctomycetes bacterium]|nr:RNA 2',3'-cyclic phosphodiesterase [Planctomycetota bacterium]